MDEKSQVHMVLDNYGTHTHDNVVAWLEILEKVSRGRVALASIPANNETPH